MKSLLCAGMKHGFRVKLVVSVTILSLIVLSCSKRPKECIGESELVDLLTDMTIAESMNQSGIVRELPDSVRDRLSESVLRQHNVTRAQLDSTMAWYGVNLDEYVELYKKVDKHLARKLQNEAGRQDIELESDDLWPLASHKWFSPLGGDNVLVFETPGESVAGGESLDWSMVFTSNPPIDLMLGVDYDNGSSTYIKRTFRGDRRLKLSLITDTAKVIKRIYGYIHVERSGLPTWADSIKLVKQPFDSTLRVPWAQKRYYGPRRHNIVKPVDSEIQESNLVDYETEVKKEAMSEPAGKQSGRPSSASSRSIQSIKSNRSRMSN
ncbi:MAG: DUF4296 domain-containing protein [Muribaculaceae bacterium]|nr:DUF4296 domain-containing protein [Muribaculaceae bacterium]